MPVSTIVATDSDVRHNEKAAREIRDRLRVTRTPSLNLISAPGAGKTLLLERTLQALNMELEITIIAADCHTSNDAIRLSEHTGNRIHAVVTGDVSHLAARQVREAIAHVDLDYADLLMIENVGNLVCPAHWDLGEDSKVVLLSVTESEDTPLKYADAFRNADRLVITKLDLLPHVDFDLHTAVGNALSVNRRLDVFYTSARTGEGMEDWFKFLRATVDGARIEVP